MAGSDPCLDNPQESTLPWMMMNMMLLSFILYKMP